MENKPQPKPENSLLNILFNIVIPILILNKLSKNIGSLWALVLALAFPLSYGIYDLAKRKKFNAFSILGLLNVSLTGGLALFKLSGIWFAVKEAAFPLLVGLFVFGSAFSKSPFISTLFLNPQLMDIEKLKKSLKEKNVEADFNELLKKATVWISFSFLFSAICNFVLAVRIFQPIDGQLDAESQSLVLNEQIASMTTWSMAVIMVPSMAFLIGIFFYMMKHIQRISGLSQDELLVNK